MPTPKKNLLSPKPLDRIHLKKLTGGEFVPHTNLSEKMTQDNK